MQVQQKRGIVFHFVAFLTNSIHRWKANKSMARKSDAYIERGVNFNKRLSPGNQGDIRR